MRDMDTKKNDQPKAKAIRDPERAIEINTIVDNRWQIVRVLGEGGFGAVYEVRDAKAGQETETYAMKVEAVRVPVYDQVLKMDVNILRRAASKNSRHFVQLFSVGSTDRVHYMVTSLVGPNLHELKKRNKGRFNFRTMGHVGTNSLQALKEMHDLGYLHRDIKPANLAIGRPPSYRELFLLDFGLCRLYKHEDGRLRRPRNRTGFRGTLRYAPVVCHKAQESCRADDLWNWLYVMIELTAGKLPWDHEIVKTRAAPSNEAIRRVGEFKERMNAAPANLLHGCPIEYLTLHQHIATLDFQSTPDYDAMIGALTRMETRRQAPDKDGDRLDWEGSQEPRHGSCKKEDARDHGKGK